MTKKLETTIDETSVPGVVKLLTTSEAAEILRISRRTVEELGKRYERAKVDNLPGKPPPSCPRYGLRRTPVTARKHFYNEADLSEYLGNCRREADGLEPVHFDSGGRDPARERSKSQGQVRD